MIDSSIKLIAETVTQNEYGGNVKAENEREIMCEVKSASRMEFFVTHPANYAGEKILEYNGERYAITRTYQASADEVEIYAGDKVGAYGSDERSESDT